MIYDSNVPREGHALGFQVLLKALLDLLEQLIGMLHDAIGKTVRGPGAATHPTPWAWGEG